VAVSETPRGSEPEEPTVRRPLLFSSGERDVAAPHRYSGRARPAEPHGTETTGAGTTGAGTTADRRESSSGPAAATPIGTPPSTHTRPTTGTPHAGGDATTAPQRRRRRLIVGGISVGAAIVVVALCLGGLGLISAVNGVRDDAAEARESRSVRDANCLELEQRLNRLAPPGATVSPAARATAIQDENAAVRIYVSRVGSQRDADAWRQLLDARTAYAEALQRQAKSRAAAFYVAPKTGDGTAVTDQLGRWSPPSCAGAVRRLAAPDL
jgi:hypothetical protein